jgi:hypothetical protein
MADFHLYTPDPDQEFYLNAAPKKKEFGEKAVSVEFYNDTDNAVDVTFLSPLHAAKNPLRVAPKSFGRTRIDPAACGEFPCAVEIVASKCPTCKTDLRSRKKHPCLIPNMMQCEEYEGDPVIIIKPQRA